jgi:hypothetical protein
VGFDGVPVNRVKYTCKRRHLPRWWEGNAYTAVVWSVAGEEVARAEIRNAERPECEEVQRLDIARAQADMVIEHATGGKVILVGEYRGLTATKKVFEDPVTETKLEYCFVEHRVDCCGNTRIVTEWLSPETDLDAVALPAKAGSVVEVFLASIRRVNGQTYYTGSVAPLVESQPVVSSHNEI